jgi:hypothetical protein
VAYVPLDVAAFNGQNFTGLACHITGSPSFTGGTSVQILMGLYPDDGTGTRPSGSRITAYDCTVTSANLAGGIIKVNFGTTPQLLPQGRYWAAFLYTYATAPSTPPSVMVNKPLCSNVLTAGASSFQSSFYGWQQTVTGTPAALPASVSSLANQFAWAGAGAPVVALVAQ